MKKKEKFQPYTIKGIDKYICENTCQIYMNLEAKYNKSVTVAYQQADL